MTKIRKSAIGVLAVLSAAMLATSTIAYAFNDKNKKLSGEKFGNITPVDDIIDTGVERYFDESVVYRLPETIAPSDEISVIVSMNVNSVKDEYDEMPFTGTLQSFLGSNSAKVASKKVETERNKLINRLKKSGIAYKLGDKYDTLLSGFEITVAASEFESLNKLFKGDAELIVGETYYQAETQIVENEVDVYDTGIFDSSASEYQGDGVVVAVLDTGCDYTHTAFSTSNFTTSNEAFTLSSVSSKVNQTVAARLTSGLTGNDVYVSKKIPFAYDYADSDSDVAPINSNHGTHVAGIIAGNDDEITGVAPNAQLAIMKVFSDKRDGARTSSILSALEDCVILGVDVINMSLGSGCGFSREIDEQRVNEIYDSIRDAGISLIASAANSYNATFGSEKNGSLGLTSNPDSGTVGSPSTYAAALSIASVDGVKTPYIKYQDDIIYFNEASTSSAKTKNFVDDVLKTVGSPDSYDFEYVTIPGVGRSSDYLETGDFYHDKIVLVKRGVTMFEDKVRVALIEKGAAGIIIYNNISGTISMSVGKDMGAVCSISQDEGEKLAKAGTGILHIAKDQTAGPFMSDFSSWGPTSDLKIKPEITAHGGEIYSCVPGQAYDRLSGTSMAAPNQAGATALIRQYVKYGKNSDGSKIFGDLSTNDVTARVNQLMMSTADIVKNKNGLAYSVRKQGAGLMNINAASSTKSYITTFETDAAGRTLAMDKTKIEFGDDKNRTGVYEAVFDITNLSGRAEKYDVGAIVMTEGVSSTYTSHGDTTVTQDGKLLDGKIEILNVTNGGFADNSVVTVNAGGTAKVSIKITLTDGDKSYIDESFKHGMYVEGFITLKAVSDNTVDMNVPYLAFFGDWTEAPIFDEEYYDTNVDEINAGLDDEDKLMADAYPTRVIGGLYSDYISTLGAYSFRQDPKATQIAANKDKIAISNQEGDKSSSINMIRSISAGLLRNCREVNISITEDSTGRCIFSRTEYNQHKSYSSGSTVYASSIDVEFSALKHNLKNNTKYTVTVDAYIDYGANSQQKNTRNTFTFPLYIDFEAPVVTDVSYRTEYDRNTQQTKLFADLSIYDNHYAMGIQLGQAVLSTDPQYLFSLNSFGKYVTPVYSSFNSTSKVTVELTDYIPQIKNSCGMRFDENGNREVIEGTNSFIVTCYDYAMNSATYEISLPDEFTALYFEQDGTAVDEIKLSPNETLDLKNVLKTFPSDSWIETLDFETGDKEIADVINQTIIAKKSGRTTVTAVGHDKKGNEVRASVNIVVLKEGDEGYDGGYSVPEVNRFALISYTTNKAYYNVSSDEREIGLTGSTNDFGGDYNLSMFPSESVTINYALNSYFPEQTSVVYKVSNSKIASVDSNGTITALAEGTTSISVSVRFNDKSTLYNERINLKVKDPYTTNSIYLTSYKGLGGVVEIPSDRGVTIINPYAFSNYEFVEKDLNAGDIIDKEDPYYIKQWYIGEDTITKVIIPEGIEEIQSYAFAKLTALEEVVLPSTLKKIGVGAFYGCEKLKKINLEHVQFINHEAFRECGLENVDLGSVVAIGNYTFADNKLVALTLPVSSQSLGEGAFSNNIYLASVQFNAPKIKIAPYVFSECSQIRTIKINAAVISAYAFDGCSALQNVELGRDVAVIGNGAFNGTSVAKFTLASGNMALTLKNNGADVYSGNKLILRAPNSTGTKGFITVDADEIADSAFYGNTSITKVVAPNATSVGDRAFEGCSNLAVIEMPKLTKIGARAFYGTSISELPDLSGISEIGDYAFADTDLTQAIIPDGVKIGEGAFYKCSSLKSVTVGDNVIIGSKAFANPIPDITFENLGNSAVFNMFYSTYRYDITDENGKVKDSVTVFRFNLNAASASELVSVNLGSNVTVGDSAFSGNTKLATLNMAGGVKIGDYAFYNAIALASADMTKVVSIGKYAFSGITTLEYIKVSSSEYQIAKNYRYENDAMVFDSDLTTSFATALTSVDLRAVNSLGEGAFANNSKLSDVKLGNLKEIAPFAFASCSALTQITLPESVNKIYGYAFFENSLESVDLSNVESIGENAFAFNKLVGVTLKEGALIGDGAFAYNEGLAEAFGLDKAVYIGAYAFYSGALAKADLTSAQYIGDYAFGVSQLKEVLFGSALEELGENPFYGCDIKTYGKIADVQFNGVTVSSELTENYDVSDNVKVIDGVLYQKVRGGMELVSYPAGKEEANFSVCDGTVRISARAFYSSGLKSVTLPYTLLAIGDKAFYGCNGLKTVVFKSYKAPVLEEEYNSDYAILRNAPLTGNYSIYKGLGISKYFMWSLSNANNYYYGANFVDNIGHIRDNIVMVRPANGLNYDTFILSQYFGASISGNNAAMDATLLVIAMIDALPVSLTLNDESAVVAAREAYDNLPSVEQQALVHNADKLFSAEQTIEYLKNREKPDDPPVIIIEEGVDIVALIGYILAGVFAAALIAYIVVTQVLKYKALKKSDKNSKMDTNKNSSPNAE